MAGEIEEGDYGEATALADSGVIFLDVATDGFGCGVCLRVADARQLIHQLQAAIEEVENHV